jgi:hypothetical protein
MSTPRPRAGGDGESLGPASPGVGHSTPGLESSPYLSTAPPTYATFSPTTLSTNIPSKSSSTRRSTILVHQKSPLLLATPPQITRALAYSHPFLLPLNKFVGLLSWTTGDPWESFLLLVVFWGVVLYGDVVIRMAGPIVVVLTLILGMYGRRFSPLSSSGWSEPSREIKDGSASGLGQGNPTGPKQQRAAGGRNNPSANGNAGHNRANSEATNTRHQKTLDEIVETLKELTGRCNTLLEPLLVLTDFLSTQRTPTSATTRPALTTLFIRILFCTPFWFALTLPPWRIITTRRVVMVTGTLALSWHSRVMRVAREIIWRSATVRRVAQLVTGLAFEEPMKPSIPLTGTTAEAHGAARKALKRHESELTKALRKQSHHHGHYRGTSQLKDAGVKFTFIIYENQRRWVGLGWTTSLFAYERSAWTDEHNHAVPSRDDFELPEVEEGSRMRWRWVEGSRWKVDGVAEDSGEPVNYDEPAGRMGWIYYDNKVSELSSLSVFLGGKNTFVANLFINQWQNGRRGTDGWGRWTRRRKWYRDAELVEIDEEELPHELEAGLPASQASNESETASITKPSHQSTAQGSVTVVSPAISEPTLDLSTEADKDKDKEKDKADDSASVLSTSSRSFFRAPSLRRRVTDMERSRRDSEAKSEAEAAALGLQVELALQGHGKESGQWGIGDEARMSLE